MTQPFAAQAARHSLHPEEVVIHGLPLLDYRALIVQTPLHLQTPPQYTHLLFLQARPIVSELILLLFLLRAIVRIFMCPPDFLQMAITTTTCFIFSVEM